LASASAFAAAAAALEAWEPAPAHVAVERHLRAGRWGAALELVSKALGKDVDAKDKLPLGPRALAAARVFLAARLGWTHAASACAEAAAAAFESGPLCI
jgi:hypothetical protein